MMPLPSPPQIAINSAMNHDHNHGNDSNSHNHENDLNHADDSHGHGDENGHARHDGSHTCAHGDTEPQICTQLEKNIDCCSPSFSTPLHLSSVLSAASPKPETCYSSFSVRTIEKPIASINGSCCSSKSSCSRPPVDINERAKASHDHGHNLSHDHNGGHNHDHGTSTGDCCSTKAYASVANSIVVEARRLLAICCDMCWSAKSVKCTCRKACCTNSCCLTQLLDSINSVLSPHSWSSSVIVEETSSNVRLMVTGMDCSSCSQSVEQKIIKIPGVTTVSISAMTGIAEIAYDPSSTFTSAEAIREVESLGYTATGMETISAHSFDFALNEPEYVGLADFVINKLIVRSMLILRCQIGVVPESVIFRHDAKSGQRRIRVEFDPSITGPRRLLEKLHENDCQFLVVSNNATLGVDSAAELKRQRCQQFCLSAAFSLPVIFIAFVVPGIGGSVEAGMELELTQGLTLSTFLLLLLASPIQLVIGQPLYGSAYRSLRYSHRANADLLVALSTGVAYFYSVVSVIAAMSGNQFTDEHFFETSTVLLTLIIFGRYLEALAKGKTSEVLEKLQAMTVSQAILLVDYNEKTKIAASEQIIDMVLVERGDVIKVLPGTRVATDGLIVWGSTMIDESMVTGESLPVLKQVGDSVLSSTVNENGMIHVRVTRTASENTLASITRLVQDAQSSQPPVQRIADQIAAWFVPAILLLTFVVFFVWLGVAQSDVVDTDEVDPITFALRFAIATLVISCPCAIGLAVPTAIMAGSGVAAQHGVVFKSGATIERCAKVTAIVLDKTGTLTHGRPIVSSYLALTESGLLHQDIWRFVGVAESGSEHPLASALLTFARAQIGLEPYSDQPFPGNAPEIFESVAGRGIRCQVDGHRICVGNMAWIEEHLVVNSAQHTILADQPSSGETCVFVSIDDQLQAVVRMRDELKPSARELIGYLQDLNIDAWMCSGDSQETALMIGKQAGLSSGRILGGQLPGNKAALVQLLQSEGHVVSMVGDGINDSPALSLSDVGMAVAQGTDIAGEAAHVLLIKDDLLDIVVALQLSRRTFKTIRWNFTWAFIYNTLAIPIAIGVFYPLARIAIPPPLAGLAELFSSLPVITFSFMLRTYKPPKLMVSEADSNPETRLEMEQLLKTVQVEA